ncbi:hypothetical protein HORIV_30680 [Vreelandella olivaria]|uniref:Uncharacterized protein n=1 Tax=Vreelandella olivaria TaxID=390919 RepID=A0ABM7GJ14_9GAMM|nr:hypothetical protein HORIV_30680 [Halomonas olivaria]
MLAAYQQLSAYIRHTITEDQHSIWMAQREGRAKNGIDHTEPAIIKMLIMARRAAERDMVFGEAIAELKLVPVSISYEYDPCDVQKPRSYTISIPRAATPKVSLRIFAPLSPALPVPKGACGCILARR